MWLTEILHTEVSYYTPGWYIQSCKIIIYQYHIYLSRHRWEKELL